MEELRKVKDVRIEGYMRIIDRLNLEIHEASKKISSEALNDESTKLLMTFPGISYYSALLMVYLFNVVPEGSDIEGEPRMGKWYAFLQNTAVR